jgi:hypothetical protein
LYATELAPELESLPNGFHIVSEELLRKHLEFATSGDPVRLENFEINDALAVLNGEEIRLSTYLNAWAQEAKKVALLHFPSAKLTDGVYKLSYPQSRYFAEGELLVEGQPIRKLSLVCEIRARITRPKVISHFEVKTRGRVISFAGEPIQVSSGSITPHSVVQTKTPRHPQ